MQKLIIFAILFGFGAVSGAEPIEGFVASNGIRIHYLDFGGRGSVIILLHGQGNTAHIFRTFAEGLIDRYHVIALTRRGHGQSDAPSGGYDPLTLAADVRGVMDALGIERAAIIGHSMADEEMTALAAQSPSRVTALVYLDAVIGRRRITEAGPDPFAENWIPQKGDGASKEAVRAFERRWVPEWTYAHERDFEAAVYQRLDGSWAMGAKPGVDEKIAESRRSYQWDYAQLKAPALAIYATHRRYWPEGIPPGATQAQLASAQAYIDGYWAPIETGSIAHFRREVPCGRILEIPDAHHQVFFSHRAEVLAHVFAFLDEAHCP